MTFFQHVIAGEQVKFVCCLNNKDFAVSGREIDLIVDTDG